MTNPVLENILSRRSVRSFKAEQIKPEEMDSILNAGQWAASGMNIQGWKLIALQSPDKLKAFNEALRQCCLNMPTTPDSPEYMLQLKEKAAAPDAQILFDCPTYIVVTYDHKEGNAMADSSLALGNMMLAAHSVGIGTCWHNLPARLTASPDILAYLKALGLPADHRIYGTLAVGYPDAPLAPPKPRRDDIIIKL